MFSRKQRDNSCQAQTTCCSYDAAKVVEIRAAIDASTQEMRALTKRIESIDHAIRALDAVRVALEAKTWMAYHKRLAGRVKAGVARAATARRDANGRYLPG